MTEWLARYEHEGEVAFRIGRQADELVAEWIGLLRLVARRDGTSYRVEEHADADLRELEKVRRGGVRSLLRHLAGKLALHGAAIQLGDRAVVLLGRARQGKSTLAAAMCAHESVALLSDDAVAVDREEPRRQLTVSPVEEVHWLDASARRAIGLSVEDPAGEDGKTPVRAERIGRPGELAAFVDLAFGEGPTRLDRLGPVEALAAIVPQTVRFVLDDPQVHRREMEVLSEVVEGVPFYRLQRPKALSLIDQSCAQVLAVLRGETPGAAVVRPA